jgi:hypothetical protein
VQTITGYLYQQTMDLIINLDTLPNRENQLVYAKPLQIHKGIDNKIKMLFKNQDQKLQSLLDTVIVFNLIDSTNYELVYSRAVNVVADKKGQAYITLDETDLNDVAAGIYNYSIKLITGENEDRIVYSDDNYNAQGQARINDTVYPRFVSSLQPKLGPFYNNNPNKNGFTDSGIVYSDVMEVLNRVKSRSVLQTAQYYGTDFTGTVEIQGSLSATMTEYPSDWFTIDTQNFDSFSGCLFSNFVGKIGLIRFKITTTSGSLDKILYRP